MVMVYSELFESFREEVVEVLSGLEEGVIGLWMLSGVVGYVYDMLEFVVYLGDLSVFVYCLCGSVVLYGYVQFFILVLL